VQINSRQEDFQLIQYSINLWMSNENVMARGGMAGGVYRGSVTSPITLNTYTLKHKFF